MIRCLFNFDDINGSLHIVVGRAGRYGSKFPVGEVTCLDGEDLPLLHSSINAPSPILEVIDLLLDEATHLCLCT